MLSLEEALELGESNVPVLIQAKNEQRGAEARRAGAAMILQSNPYATFLGGYRKEATSPPTATGFQYQFHIEQSLEVAGQRWARLKAVDKAVEVARAYTEYARTQARALLRVAYIQSVLQEERVAVSQNREEIAQRLLESARARSELGAASDIEVNLAQIEVGRVSADLTDARVALETRLAELRVLTGIPQTTRIRLSLAEKEPPQIVLDQQGRRWRGSPSWPWATARTSRP